MILRLLGNKTIQFNTRVKKCEPGLRNQLKIDIKSTTKSDFHLNLPIYFSKIRWFRFPFSYFRHLQTLNMYVTMFL